MFYQFKSDTLKFSDAVIGAYDKISKGYSNLWYCFLFHNFLQISPTSVDHKGCSAAESETLAADMTETTGS